MADFRGTILTQKGLNLLAKAQAGATLTFTKIKLGDGLWATGTDPYQLNEIISPKMNLPIQHIEVAGDGTVRLRFVLTNIGLTQGFFMREIGIYAQDPDFGEILYAVAYAADRPDFIPSDGTTKVENVVDIYTVIANAQNVTAVISDTVLLATKQDVDKVKSEAGATAPLLTYAGKLWVNTNENNFLKYFDGSNWQNVKVPFADTVDGFHASQTPAPNVIVPLDTNGILDLNATYVKSNVYTFRRVDLTNASSDYMLQVGEEAIVNFDNINSVPLHIATQSGTYYEMRIVNSNMYATSGGNGGSVFLLPNNTWYNTVFKRSSIFRYSASSSSEYSYVEGFTCGTAYTHSISYVVNYTQYKNLINYFDSYGVNIYSPLLYITSIDWEDTTTTWTSFGTITFPQQASGYVLVRRLK